MFDFSFGEIAVIGAVALVVLGPERLPKVARTAGEWMGKAQRYVSQVKSDINREMELAELKKLQEEARNAAQSVQSGFTDMQSDFNRTAEGLNSSLTTPIAGETSSSLTIESVTGDSAGTYKVRVSNSVGFVDSNEITITVPQAPIRATISLSILP